MANKASNIRANIALDGEKEFKEAIRGINSDMKVLGSEMKKVTSEFKDNTNSVEALTAKQKVLKDQIDAQTKKVDENRKMLAKANETYGEADDRTKAYKIQLNNAETQLNDLNSELRKNDKALDDAKTSTVQLASATDKYGDEADKAGAKTLKMGDIIKANLISDAIISGVKALASAVKDIAMSSLDAADEIASLATKTGFTTTEIQQFQYAGKALDVDLEVITGSLSKLTKSMTLAKGGAGAQADAFKALKISVKNSDGSLRDSKTVMFEVIEALGKVANETERDSMAMQIFGKSAMELNPLIKAGSEELNNLMQAALDNGAVMSDSTINGLDGFKDASELLNQELTALAGEVLVELMPTFQDLIAWFRDNKDEIKRFATEAVQAVIDAFDWFVKNKDTVIPAMELIGAAVLVASGPVGALVAGFIAMNELIKAFQGNPEIEAALGAIGIAAAGAAIAVGALQSAWSLGLAGVAIAASIWLIADSINQVTKNKAKPGQEGTGGGHWNAEGGIFTKPTMFATPAGYQGVGEAGAEAIIPLSKLPSYVGQMIDYEMLGNAVAGALQKSPAIAVIPKSEFSSAFSRELIKAV